MIKTFSLIRFVMVLCLAIVFHDSIYSQSVMHAKVEDGDGLPIPMAVVAVVSTDNQELSSSISDTNGVFELLLPREIEGTHVYIKAFGYNAVQMQTQEALSQTVLSSLEIGQNWMGSRFPRMRYPLSESLTGMPSTMFTHRHWLPDIIR